MNFFPKEPQKKQIPSNVLLAADQGDPGAQYSFR